MVVVLVCQKAEAWLGCNKKAKNYELYLVPYHVAAEAKFAIEMNLCGLFIILTLSTSREHIGKNADQEL